MGHGGCRSCWLLRTPQLDLPKPLLEARQRGHDEARPAQQGLGAGEVDGPQQRDRLDGLAQAHLVRQDARALRVPVEAQPPAGWTAPARVAVEREQSHYKIIIIRAHFRIVRAPAAQSATPRSDCAVWWKVEE